MENQIILVDNDRDFLEILKGKLSKAGFMNIQMEDDPIKAAALFAGGTVFDIALIDMTMPHMDGLELLDRVKATSPRTECIMVTAVNDARVAVECLKKGAYDYLVKPITQEDLVFSMNRTLERKRLLDVLNIGKSKSLPDLVHKAAFKAIITRSRKMFRGLKEAELHAGSDVPVLITGESGTGKELLARAIHKASSRAAFPFTAINMASLSQGLFDAEFFGHTRGAFTGAQNDRGGYLKHTNHGTLFLDEIGNLPFALQGKLLRVLQDGEYIKLGTSRRRQADVRFIAATNVDLDRLLAKGTFRKDLYYRIRGGWLHLPPLRERQEDIPLLANRFLREYCHDNENCRIQEEAMGLLMKHDYPGNIRELKSIIQSAANLAQGGPIVSNCLPPQLRRKKTPFECSIPSGADAVIPLAQMEKAYILDAYEKTGRNKSRTARLLKIGLNTLRRKLKS